jgi:hypothetical protein
MLIQFHNLEHRLQATTVTAWTEGLQTRILLMRWRTRTPLIEMDWEFTDKDPLDEMD